MAPALSLLHTVKGVNTYSVPDALNSIENSTYRTAFKLRSLQTLCQLDLIGSSLIQHVLLRQHLWEAGESTLSLQQLFQALQAMFQKVRVEKPGQVHPRASELTLSLLTTMYDSTGTGFLKLAPAAAALITLSGDSPLTKYRALFQLYAENNRGGHDLGARMTRRVLRNLLTDLQQIPTVVGESRALCSVESATRSCFQGVLSPVIKEEKFLSWLQSEPPILLWIPTCYRLSATEMATHPVRCRICRNFPITGLRYRCLKCLNFDICQVCFLSSLQGESHQKSHPVVENCIQMSAKDNTKLILRTLRNNLLQGRCRRKEAARRQWLLHKVNPKDMANRAWARLLKKRLNRYKDKLQAIYACQEEKSCRYDTKIHKLTSQSGQSVDQLMGQDLQAMLQPLHPSSFSWQNVIAKGDHGKGEERFQNRGGDSSQIKGSTEDGSQQETLPKSTVINGSHRGPAPARHALPNSELPEATLKPRPAQSPRAQSQAQKTSKETSSALPSSQEGRLQDIPKIPPVEMTGLALAPGEKKGAMNIQERKDELEEELQELLSKLTDPFTLEAPSDLQSSVNLDLYCGAEGVCRAFSALVDQITLTDLK
ncbi:LOW QUALITY PROTEIN: dystrotelin [Cervus canadensis]|uniref:LOW QUALITY PROTEIN: dystrotelin n=1 Tax=Cervus canadensis TaxID=1574408 RepID=UPI001CA34642|nr:LOW QUALITY PROTEIN: dystrotelin [Cervus canadensis]